MDVAVLLIGKGQVVLLEAEDGQVVEVLVVPVEVLDVVLEKIVVEDGQVVEVPEVVVEQLASTMPLALIWAWVWPQMILYNQVSSKNIFQVRSTYLASVKTFKTLVWIV